MKPLTFYDIYYTPLKELDDKHAGKFFRMICDFLDGKQVTIDAERDKEISPEFELYCHFRRSGNVPQIGRQKLRTGQTVQALSVSAVLPKGLYLFKRRRRRRVRQNDRCIYVRKQSADKGRRRCLQVFQHLQT